MHVRSIRKSLLIHTTLFRSTYVVLNRSNSGSVRVGEDAAEKQQAFSLSKTSWKEVTCMFKHNDSASSFNNQINASEIGNQVWEALTLKASCQLSYFLVEAEHF